MTDKKSKNSEFQRLERELLREVGSAISDYSMIEDGDKVMVCLSGGKDSYTLLSMLLALKRKAPIDFSIVAMNLDQAQPGFPTQVLPDYLQALGVEFHIETEDTYSIVMDKVEPGKTTCSLCSRLRRGIIYRVARQLGANKVALGHHRDDILETFFLNMFFGARLKAMPAKLRADNGEHILIRPLAYAAEATIERYAQLSGYPIIPCNLCGSQENLQRKQIKTMITNWEREFPGRSRTMLGALRQVVPSHLLDRELFDFSLAFSTSEQKSQETPFKAVPGSSEPQVIKWMAK